MYTCTLQLKNSRFRDACKFRNNLRARHISFWVEGKTDYESHRDYISLREMNSALELERKSRIVKVRLKRAPES